jgi:hypothetical protein
MNLSRASNLPCLLFKEKASIDQNHSWKSIGFMSILNEAKERGQGNKLHLRKGRVLSGLLTTAPRSSRPAASGRTFEDSLPLVVRFRESHPILPNQRIIPLNSVRPVFLSSSTPSFPHHHFPLFSPPLPLFSTIYLQGNIRQVTHISPPAVGRLVRWSACLHPLTTLSQQG